MSDAVYGLLRLQGRVDRLLSQALATRKLSMEKLAKLGYDGEHASKRSHHKDDADKKPA